MRGGHVREHFMITLEITEGDNLRVIVDDLYELARAGKLIVREEGGVEREFRLNEAEEEILEGLQKALERDQEELTTVG